MSKSHRRTPAERIHARKLREFNELSRRAQESVLAGRRPATPPTPEFGRIPMAIISKLRLGYRVREIGQYGSAWRPTRRWAERKAQAMGRGR